MFYFFVLPRDFFVVSPGSGGQGLCVKAFVALTAFCHGVEVAVSLNVCAGIDPPPPQQTFVVGDKRGRLATGKK